MKSEETTPRPGVLYSDLSLSLLPLRLDLPSSIFCRHRGLPLLGPRQVKPRASPGLTTPGEPRLWLACPMVDNCVLCSGMIRKVCLLV